MKRNQVYLLSQFTSGYDTKVHAVGLSCCHSIYTLVIAAMLEVYYVAEV